MKILYIHSPKFGTKEVLLDDADYEKFKDFKWYLRKSKGNFYVQRDVLVSGKSWRNGIKKRYQMHREVLNITDPSVLIDHADRNSLNNQSDNLRVCTYSQNIANKEKRKGTSSKYIGVCKCTERNKYLAYVQTGGRVIFRKRFDNEIEAAKARDIKAIEIHGEFAVLTFTYG